MLARIGQGLAVILFIGGALHAYGSFVTFPAGSGALVWSVGSAAFAIFLALLAFVANGSAMPTAVLLVLEIGLVAWLATVVAFAFTLPSVMDPRVLYHVVVTALLMVQVAALSMSR